MPIDGRLLIWPPTRRGLGASEASPTTPLPEKKKREGKVFLLSPPPPPPRVKKNDTFIFGSLNLRGNPVD